MSVDFERLNRDTQESKAHIEPAREFPITGSELLRRKNYETYKENNGQYPRSGYFK